MSENISMTRISDLPDMGSSSIPFMKNEMILNESSNIYIPLNPHPNPYGVGDQAQGVAIPPPPQPEQYYSQPQEPVQYQQPIQQPEYRLPQRDIPMDITEFTHDEQIKPNYIPKPKVTSDYVEKHEQATKSKIREYEEDKQKEAAINHWVDQLYQPILLGILYFIFQLPIVNTMIFKRFSFLAIYKDDGNFNLWGLVLKSILFALLFFVIHKSTQWLIEFF